MAKVRLTEAQLQRIVEDSVKQVLNEGVDEISWKGVKNAFGNLGRSFGKDAKSVYGNVKGHAGAMAGAVGNAAKKYGQKVQDAYDTASQYAADKKQQFKKGIAQGDIQTYAKNMRQELIKFRNLVQQWGLDNSGNFDAAVDNLLNQFPNLLGRTKRMEEE